MNKRVFLTAIGGLAAFTLLQLGSKHNKVAIHASANIQKWERSDEFWQQQLTPAEYAILRKGATEPRFSSKLTKFDQAGTYHCVACKLALFQSDMKYDSKTGWPSFFDHIKGHIETYTDLRGMSPSLGYKCAQCSGHHGHLIMDGPLPTGRRWCNNGQVLEFRASATSDIESTT